MLLAGELGVLVNCAHPGSRLFPSPRFSAPGGLQFDAADLVPAAATTVNAQSAICGKGGGG